MKAARPGKEQEAFQTFAILAAAAAELHDQKNID